MIFKQGSGWKACYDEARDYYAAEYGGVQDYHLYEITKALYDRLEPSMDEWEASRIIHDGRHLYMSVNDRCGPPYTVVFDDDYKTLCPWADVVGSGKVMPDALTDAAVELLSSEAPNRAQRREKREKRHSE